MKSFLDLSQPPEPELETESEKHTAALKQNLQWFYQRGIQVIIKPNRHGYSLVFSRPQAVIVPAK